MSGGRGRGQGRGNGNHERDSGICFHFQRGKCRWGSACRYSHELTPSGDHQRRGSTERNTRAEETSDESYARANYMSWRALIRRMPVEADLHAMQDLWDGALEVLNGEDRNWKQTLPKDLDDDQAYNGRNHIQALMCKRTSTHQHHLLIEIAHSFLQVITHTAIVDCLSVDTYVGSLYNFLSGANGTRAVPFFQHICEILVATGTEDGGSVLPERLDSTMIALLTALSELLRREQRARFNEGLSDLIHSLETASRLINVDRSAVKSDLMFDRIRHLRNIVARADELLSGNMEFDSEANSNSGLDSEYPRDIVVPGNRHDNDMADITEIDIFPTRAEVMSDSREFLPFTDRDQPHFLTAKAERHIDTQFRLLRHDIFGNLKDALRGLMKSITDDPNQMTNPKLGFGDIRAYTYTNASVSRLILNSRGGLQIRMSFLAPYNIRKKCMADRRRWWEESRRLAEGVLLSFIWIQDSVVQHQFFTVAERSTDKKDNDGQKHNDNMAYVTIKLTTQNPQAVETLLVLSRQQTRGVLLEYPNVLPATYVPVLRNLQDMQRSSQLPFSDWILPERVDHPHSKLDVPPPLYARDSGFVFSLDSILSSHGSSISLHPSAAEDDNFSFAEMETKTGLDHGQCLALIAALKHEFAFIQGPPGTGKSYLGVKLMKVLLDVKRRVKLGPIVVVCYTNHALDQFLEHLIKTGIRKIIRVGGQSQSDLLENHNLRTVAQTEGKTKHESWQAATSYQKLGECEEESKRILGRLHGLQKRVEWKYLDRHIARKYGRIHTQFRTVDDDGFTVVGRHPFDVWVADSDHRDTQPETATTAMDPARIVEKASQNVRSLSPAEKAKLIEVLTEELQRDATEEFFDTLQKSEGAQSDLANVHEEINRRVLQGAEVIGLTTTGLAKNISTLRHVGASIVICEEAGEVMEPHMISALLPSVEHFIQIGDHQQLRPSINNFRDLSLESDQGVLYQLDRSQFERLSIGERGRPSMPVAQLNIQRRMRPDISALIRETIYDKLIDHPTTMQFPNVVGMRDNIFWLNHDNIEDEGQAEIQHKKSKSNNWEVKMVHALVRHIIRQGIYASNDIAVLTPYTGQLQRLRKAMRDDFEIVLSERDEDALIKDGFGGQDSSDDQTGLEQEHKRTPLAKKKLTDLLRVATVDNFQGEEAKVIIISLVRSNKNCKVGFLKTTNRINVLLSRAQHGMYVIGNAATYSNVPMWQTVIDMLHAKNSIGLSLGLCCPRHPDTAIQVQHADDFAKFSPEGGCREACMDRLPDCGHRCQARCHSKAMHEVFRCEQPCQRRHRPCDHPCQKSTCGEDCGRCTVAMNEVALACGHIYDDIPCYLTLDLNTIECSVVVDKKVPQCGHTVQVRCSQDVSTDTYQCSSPCEAILPCGHQCSGSCGRCNVEEQAGSNIDRHGKCIKVCRKPFPTCNHICPKRCHNGSECGLCTVQCEVACKHSRCTLKCHEACAPCIERCTWSCPHQGECTLPCSAPCNRLPCNERCTELLPCGHQCPGLCGEECLADYCRECEMKLDAQVDMIEFMEYRDIDLDSSPVIALTCGHFFTVETLDGLVGLDEVYKIDQESGKIVGLEDITSEMAPTLPKCPECRRPIRQYASQRYNRLINRAVIDEMSKRFIVTGQRDLQGLAEKLDKLETELDKSRSEVTKANVIPNLEDGSARAAKDAARQLQTRYKTPIQLRSAIIRLQRSVDERHQPTHKLHEATIHAIQRGSSLESALNALNLQDTPAIVQRDHRIIFGAKMMEIKIDCITIEDKLGIYSSAKAKYEDSADSLQFTGGSPLTLTPPFMQTCVEFIPNCIKKALPKLAVETSLYYARIARLFETSRLPGSEDRRKATEYHEQAKLLLEGARKLCGQGFLNAESLALAVDESLKLLQKEWYQDVTSEELEAIKRAMVSGPGGIASHSGHWYNCVNGHPFAIGECGMPMQIARCPECGERVGGQSHRAVEGVTRARNME